MNSLIESLASRLSETGPAGRRHAIYPLGAVALIVYPHRGDLAILATERHLELPQHAGQISLPGGGVQESDASPAAAALRETEEELGIPAHGIRLLGPLGWFPIEVTGWDVVAYIGYWDGIDPLVRQETEVETILEVPLADLLEQHRRRYAGQRFSPREYPEYEHHQDGRTFRIWGCTGRILHHFLEAVYLPAASAR